MDTQNTSLDVSSWNRSFWMLSLSGLLLMMSVYVMVASMPPYLSWHGMDDASVALVMGVYGLALFVPGCFCSYLVERYRRGRVCRVAMLGAAFSAALLYYLEFSCHVHVELWMLVGARILQGVCVSLAAMVLLSTLVVDVCSSFLRTASGHVAAWFVRFALSLGPLSGLLVYGLLGYAYTLALSAVLALVAWALVGTVSFPFKAPLDSVRVVSLDRFFLPQGFPLFVNVLLVAATVGLMVSFPHTPVFWAMTGVGLLAALLAERFVFVNAELKSEVISGLILLFSSILIVLTSHQLLALSYVSPAMLGFAVGIIGRRFLLYYVKLAHHCQRGTSQSSFFLAWESGLTLGLVLGLAVVPRDYIMLTCLALVVVSFLLYHLLVHSWYMKHKSR